jgi:hypothetical protein
MDRRDKANSRVCKFATASRSLHDGSICFNAAERDVCVSVLHASLMDHTCAVSPMFVEYNQLLTIIPVNSLESGLNKPH